VGATAVCRSDQQKYHVGAAAFDRERGLLYILEPLADADKPLVHVWRVRSLPISQASTHPLA